VINLIRRRCKLAAAVVALMLAVGLFTVGQGEASPRDTTSQGAATAAPAGTCLAYLATNAALQTRVITNNAPGVYSLTSWQTLTCGATSISVPRGKRGLVVVEVDAELTCTGADGQWCLGRALIAGLEGQPNAPEPDSFSWANSEPNPAQWEANTFTRTAILSCPATFPAARCVYPVVVQVRNHAAGLSFRVDDATIQAQVTYF
jgi:hypothetical protein